MQIKQTFEYQGMIWTIDMIIQKLLSSQYNFADTAGVK